MITIIPVDWCAWIKLGRVNECYVYRGHRSFNTADIASTVFQSGPTGRRRLCRGSCFKRELFIHLPLIIVTFMNYPNDRRKQDTDQHIGWIIAILNQNFHDINYLKWIIIQFISSVTGFMAEHGAPTTTIWNDYGRLSAVSTTKTRSRKYNLFEHIFRLHCSPYTSAIC